MERVLGFIAIEPSVRYRDFKDFYHHPLVRLNIRGPAPPLQPLLSSSGLALSPPPGDLISTLLAEVAAAEEHGGALLPAPEEIVFIQLVRPPPEYGTAKDKERRPFGFPARFAVDPFLEGKRAITGERRRKRAEVEERVIGLEKKREELTRFDVSDNRLMMS
jgi:hypothetical protein